MYVYPCIEYCTCQELNTLNMYGTASVVDGYRHFPYFSDIIFNNL